MGLDGISINQLRVTQENNSAEMNRLTKHDSIQHKVVDGLSDSQKVDPDKEKEKDSSGFGTFDEDQEQPHENEQQQETIKYDLSDNSRYLLKLDDDSNNILILEKSTKRVVQMINSDELSHFVGFLTSSQGSIVNRKF